MFGFFHGEDGLLFMHEEDEAAFEGDYFWGVGDVSKVGQR